VCVDSKRDCTILVQCLLLLVFIPVVAVDVIRTAVLASLGFSEEPPPDFEQRTFEVLSASPPPFGCTACCGFGGVLRYGLGCVRRCTRRCGLVAGLNVYLCRRFGAGRACGGVFEGVVAEVAALAGCEHVCWICAGWAAVAHVGGV